MQDVYRPLYINETPIVYTNVPTAEMIKYANNCLLATQISAVNELANIAAAIGDIDILDVREREERFRERPEQIG